MFTLKVLSRICFLILFFCCFSAGCSVKNAITELFTERSFSGSLTFIDDNTPAAQDKLLDAIPTKFVGYIGATSHEPKVRRDMFLSFSVHRAELMSIAVAAGGLSAYSADAEGNVFYSEIIDAKGKAPLRLQTRLILSAESKINMLALSRDGRFIAVCTADKIILADLQDKKIAAELTKISGRVTALSWSADNEYLAIGQIGRIILWKIFDDGEFVAHEMSNSGSMETYKGGITPVVGIYFYNPPKMLFSADHGGHLSVRRLLKTEREMGLWGNDEKNLPLDVNTKNVNVDIAEAIDDFTYNEIHNELITALGNGTVLWWKIRGLIPVKMLDIGRYSVKNIALLSYYDEKNHQTMYYFVTSSNDNIVKLWNAEEEGGEEAENSSIRKLPKNIKLSRTMRFVDKKKSLNFQSDVFDEPIFDMKSAPDSPYLWLIQKSGKIIIVNI